MGSGNEEPFERLSWKGFWAVSANSVCCRETTSGRSTSRCEQMVRGTSPAPPLRGPAAVEIPAGPPNERSLSAAVRYAGNAVGRAWAARTAGSCIPIARIAIRPDWVELVDFPARPPPAIAGDPG
jgi:hypothetical protein